MSLNLPLRPPAVLARAAAGLDLLSGGRFDLALGAGAFWDAMVAMGVPRRSPGESITALTEAIEVIRAIWDTETRGGVRLDGEFYPMSGAKRGPRPAHPIEIWLGGYKPRMLRLIGRARTAGCRRSATWGPTNSARPTPSSTRRREEAGRDPATIRRLVNVIGSFSATATGFSAGPRRPLGRRTDRPRPSSTG